MVKYVITDGKRWIRKDRHGKYVPTNSGALADEFTRKQAEGIFNNSLAKPLKLVFRVEPCSESKELEGFSKTVKKPTKQSIIENTENVMDRPEIQKWLIKVKELNGLLDEINAREKELGLQMCLIEKQLLDWRHYVEFSKLNAADGYAAYKKQKAKLQKRRTIKNELSVLGIITDCITKNTYDEIEKRVAGLDKRSYAPRDLDELFDL